MKWYCVHVLKKKVLTVQRHALREAVSCGLGLTAGDLGRDAFRVGMQRKRDHHQLVVNEENEKLLSLLLDMFKYFLNIKKTVCFCPLLYYCEHFLQDDTQCPCTFLASFMENRLIEDSFENEMHKYVSGCVLYSPFLKMT